ncbi:glycerophosphodiester phosphodiesterase family protein [Sediminispirochaeta bajacaliforniensis]|uniref:glycerophosphodiester phosphodiesterase family protein n=1 Tax=Sediminispirochaeta bajacaliforniensis TaxID=148 RepID=UPI000381ECAE|nr:glycerophosphodiester phosphodiesterase family protein [Sediminispirochaeta bajacaliforniensis]
MKRKRSLFLIVLCLVVFVVVNNCQILPVKSTEKTELLDHRGLAQTFDISKVKWDTNTAEVIYPPEYPYIDNTLPSMEAAFKYGADIIGFDIRVTKDKNLAVFHDFQVDYRTERKGNILLQKLRSLNPDQRKNLSIYGNDKAIQIVKEEYPEMKALSAIVTKQGQSSSVFAVMHPESTCRRSIGIQPA